MSGWLSPEQVAKRLGLDRRTILRRIRSGELGAYCIGPRTYRVSERQLEMWLESIATSKAPPETEARSARGTGAKKGPRPKTGSGPVPVAELLAP